MTLYVAEGGGTTDRSGMNLGAPLSGIVVPGGTDGTKATIVHNAETGIPEVPVERVTTQKSILTTESASKTANAREEFREAQMPGVAEKFLNHVTVKPTERRKNLNVVTNGSVQREDTKRRIAQERRHFYDSLRKLHKIKE